MSLVVVPPEVACLDGSVESFFRGIVSGTVFGILFAKELHTPKRKPGSSSSNATPTHQQPSAGVSSSRPPSSGKIHPHSSVLRGVRWIGRRSLLTGKTALYFGSWCFVTSFMSCALRRIGVPYPLDAGTGGAVAGALVSVVGRESANFFATAVLGSAAFSIVVHGVDTDKKSTNLWRDPA
ncbi:unnamed protein product [Vitrella brassicaformis CCMP3155]|uniref:Uncharacterized protein n=1 Tax=Vitrella brassicaformis (strain CCMP3155) TaxID=1169540 RepID=A0A0G4GYK1_VITBC|nr:unnamed protein product [Vitrella brassicaformis CCMP3155]|eukprot:CEM36209.1 unnamed protein product [Vitrella brassicaformis CCMP3155]